jgi:hypothetical protein
MTVAPAAAAVLSVRSEASSGDEIAHGEAAASDLTSRSVMISRLSRWLVTASHRMVGDTIAPQRVRAEGVPDIWL